MIRTVIQGDNEDEKSITETEEEKTRNTLAPKNPSNAKRLRLAVFSSMSHLARARRLTTRTWMIHSSTWIVPRMRIDAAINIEEAVKAIVEGTIYETIEGRFRIIRKEVMILGAEIDIRDRPKAPADSVKYPKFTTAVNSLPMDINAKNSMHRTGKVDLVAQKKIKLEKKADGKAEVDGIGAEVFKAEAGGEGIDLERDDAAFEVTIHPPHLQPFNHQQRLSISHFKRPKGQELIDWTPENDAKLMLTILVVENVYPNCEKVAAAFGGAVNAMAISNCLSRLRKKAADDGLMSKAGVTVPAKGSKGTAASKKGKGGEEGGNGR
ncbi:hypothetical protein HO173_003275 [Letharia columbiana]|uniref:Uncharacterized protein n=1 Tax=Letharia columbiana TaxID=112416 RepID=A0A8H6L7V9_9LECA|nr:uncharacterized protein HO173_003275 [Letharia columbiana]KAF6238768.1 hypothetical protein HO173_003275 [Letharia columbiana]